MPDSGPFCPETDPEWQLPPERGITQAARNQNATVIRAVETIASRTGLEGENEAFLHKLHIGTGTGGSGIAGQILSAGQIRRVRLNLPNPLPSAKNTENVGSIRLAVTFGVHYQPLVRSKTSLFQTVLKTVCRQLNAHHRQVCFEKRSTDDRLLENKRWECMDAYSTGNNQQ